MESLEVRQFLSASVRISPLAVIANRFVADNGDASKATFSGTWKTAATEAGFFASNYAVGTGAATFKPAAATTSNYNVLLHWTTGSGHASNAQVDIKTPSGTASMLVDQRTRGGVWVNVGTYAYAPANFEVTFRTSGADGAVIADAVIIERTTAAATSFPVAPASLALAAPTYVGVNLSWLDKATGEKGYRIERSTDGKSWTMLTATAANATAYQDKAVSPDTLYYYRIRTTYAAYDSIYGNTASVRTPKIPPPAAPQALVATAPTYNRVDLKWTDAANNESAYAVERSPDGAKWTRVASLAANAAAWSDATVAEKTKYFYRVVASNTSGNSPFSNVVNVTTPPMIPPPAGPKSLSATALVYNRVSLSWADAANNETAYAVERSANGTTWTRVASLGANATAWSDTSTSEKTLYYYRVAASNTSGASPWSNVTTVTTPPEVVLSEPIIGAYVVPIENMDRWKTYGVNTLFHSETQGGRYTQAQWRAAARKRGFYYVDIPSGNIAADEADPNLIAYLLPDEPDMHKWPVSMWSDVYDTIKAGGGHKPIFGNFSGPDVTGGKDEAIPYDGRNQKPFLPYADWIGSDWYVKNKNVDRYPIQLMVDAMNLLAKWSGGKPQLSFIECGDINISAMGRAPTEDEMQAEVRAVMNQPNAIGYVYFPVRCSGDTGRGYQSFIFDNTTATMRIAITQINAEMLQTKTITVPVFG